MLAHLVLLLLPAALAVPQNRSAPYVVTELGAIEGRVRGDVAEYLGIPFAQPPVNEFRFAPPQPPAPWDGVHDATQFKHNCMQGSMNMGWAQPLSTQSEDCVRGAIPHPPCLPTCCCLRSSYRVRRAVQLYLNVYAPAIKPTKPVPVMFWIFGGGFQGGGMLSTFCDRILKTGGEKLSDELIEKNLEDVVQLFSYLTDKDFFAEIYRNQLAKRLLNGAL